MPVHFPKLWTIGTQLGIGAIAAVADLSIFYICSFYVGVYQAFIIGFIIGVIFNYTLSIKLSFIRGLKIKSISFEFLLFCLTYVFTAIVQLATIYILIHFDTNLYIAKISACFVGFAGSFLIKWLLIFGPASEHKR